MIMHAPRHALVALAFSSLFLAAQSSGSRARPLADVMESKTLRIVAYEDNRPFSWTDEGVAKGIDVDLAKALARELGVEPSIELRMNGERVDQDLRVNLWRGSPGGGDLADLVMHIPTDEELATKMKEALLVNPYFEERVALAIDPKRVPLDADFQIFKKVKVGVKLATVADYFLMGFEDGALVNNISHYVRDPVGVKEFLDGETAAIFGVRSETEGLLHEVGAKATFIEPDMTGIIRRKWVVGMALHESSRDVGDALGQALTKLRKSGELAKIFAKYGVTHVEKAAN